jgi:hypothetical protein
VFVASPSLPLQLTQKQRCQAEINGKKSVVVGDASGMARATAAQLETPMLNVVTLRLDGGQRLGRSDGADTMTRMSLTEGAGNARCLGIGVDDSLRGGG